MIWSQLSPTEKDNLAENDIFVIQIRVGDEKISKTQFYAKVWESIRSTDVPKLWPKWDMNRKLKWATATAWINRNCTSNSSGAPKVGKTLVNFVDKCLKASGNEHR